MDDDKIVAETIFGRLRESSISAALEEKEFTFKVDRKSGRLLGSVVKLDGKLYESSSCGDGMNVLIKEAARRQGFSFKTSLEAGLFK